MSYLRHFSVARNVSLGRQSPHWDSSKVARTLEASYWKRHLALPRTTTIDRHWTSTCRFCCQPLNPCRCNAYTFIMVAYFWAFAWLASKCCLYIVRVSLSMIYLSCAVCKWRDDKMLSVWNSEKIVTNECINIAVRLFASRVYRGRSWQLLLNTSPSVFLYRLWAGKKQKNRYTYKVRLDRRLPSRTGTIDRAMQIGAIAGASCCIHQSLAISGHQLCSHFSVFCTPGGLKMGRAFFFFAQLKYFELEQQLTIRLLNREWGHVPLLQLGEVKGMVGFATATFLFLKVLRF